MKSFALNKELYNEPYKERYTELYNVPLKLYSTLSEDLFSQVLNSSSNLTSTVILPYIFGQTYHLSLCVVHHCLNCHMEHTNIDKPEIICEEKVVGLFLRAWLFVGFLKVLLACLKIQGTELICFFTPNNKLKGKNAERQKTRMAKPNLSSVFCACVASKGVVFCFISNTSRGLLRFKTK